jgi:glyoxylase-like metal-dependent hydrolase (beta-lactamase superfamily II)
MGALLLAAILVAAAPPRFSVTEVGPGVFAAVADPSDESSLGNAGFIVGTEAVLVVDAFATPAAAERLLSEIRSKTTLPIRFAVITHFHRDHMGGNAVFARAGAAVLAHENVRVWAHREWDERLTDEQRARYASLRLPDVTYRDRLSVWLGGRMVEVFHRPGHTGSDSIVSVPDARVVFGGDLVLKACIPGLTFARTEAWSTTLDELLKNYPDWTFVPGHGQPGKALDVRLFRDYLNGLRLAVSRAMREGKSGAAVIEAVKPQLASRYGRWTGFESVDGNIADMEAELTGTKAYPPARPD